MIGNGDEQPPCLGMAGKLCTSAPASILHLRKGAIGNLKSEKHGSAPLIVRDFASASVYCRRNWGQKAIMGTVTELRAARRVPTRSAGQRVKCEHCGERHPFVKLGDGTVRCVTAFSADGRWFCRNRGCRAAWLERQPSEGQ